MKLTLAATLLALCFATGFTCSKNTPEAQDAAPATQEQMAVPTEGTPPPAEGAPAEAAPEAAPAPTEH
jgi:hypothetical protein